MSNDNNEHQRALKQEAHKKKRIDFHREHGRWPDDSEISEAPSPAAVQPDDPFDRWFEPRD